MRNIVARLQTKQGPDRVRLLAKLCGGDSELRTEVESLLSWESAPDDQLGTLGFEAAIGRGIEDFLHELQDGHLPSSIGDFEVLRELGEGGTGVVYLAQQTAPVTRQVALKVIRPGMDSREVLSRFRSEQRTLALMSHPNIAAVHDAGVTAQQRPFFVLEYVDGEPITHYCQSRQLPLDQRLELVRKVCEGVQHAHHKGVVHRDLKPTNILVTEVDGEPVPKIIDFGIAKTLEPDFANSMHTQMGQLLGTIEYMSPEQASLGNLDIDTRTDVYSLGVLLYEILTGSLPFAWHDQKVPFDERLRQVRTQEPQRPSTRLREEQSARLHSLVNHLEEDLDWIVLRALAKDRDQRYLSPTELSADLGRHLATRPIEARPPARGYQVRKFYRRNRTAVVVGTLAILSLVVGLTAATVGLNRARLAEKRAYRESQTASASKAFLVDLFQVSDPGVARGNAITAREVLDRGLEQVRTELAAEPEVQSELMATMAEVYGNLGLYRTSRKLFADALVLRSDLWGATDPLTVDTAFSLGWMENELGHHVAADSLMKWVVAQRSQNLGTEAPEVAEALNVLAASYRNQDRYQEAEPIYLRALKIRESALGPDHPDVAQSLNNLAGLYYYQAKYREAEPMWLRALEIRRNTYGEKHGRVATTLSNLGALHSRLQDFPAAESYQKQSLAIREEILGPENIRTAHSLQGLGSCYVQQGRMTDAVPLLERALRIRRSEIGPEHVDIAWSLNYLAQAYVGVGRLSEAESMFKEALAMDPQVVSAKHTVVASCHHSLGMLHATRGETAAARSQWAAALELRREILGEQHPDFLATLAELEQTQPLEPDEH